MKIQVDPKNALLGLVLGAGVLFTVAAVSEAPGGKYQVDVGTYRAGALSDEAWQKVRDTYKTLPPELVDQWRPFTLPQQNPPPGVPKFLGNQKLAALGYVDVTAPPFSADNTGKTDTTKSLQAAVDCARDYQMAAFFPPGDYRVSDTILAEVSFNLGGKESKKPSKKAARDKPAEDSDAEADADGLRQNGDGYNIWQGSTADPAKRARIVLAANAPGFNDQAKPKLVVFFRNAVSLSRIHEGGKNQGMLESSTIHYNQIYSGIDITVEPGNAGAVGLRMRGAEGCTIQDTTIDVTHGHTGIWGTPASGGSTHKVTVIGGDIGIDMRDYPNLKGIGEQPSPSFSQLRLVNQRQYAMWVRSRGATVVVGADFKRDTPGTMVRLDPHWYGEPYDSSLGLVDCTFDFGQQNPGNVCISRTPAGGINHGRGFYFNNVFVHNAANIATVGKEQASAVADGNEDEGTAKGPEVTPPNDGGNAPDTSSDKLALSGGQWVQYRELAVAGDPARGRQGIRYVESVFLNGQPADGGGMFYEDKTTAEPPADLVTRHGWGDNFPSFENPGATPVTDFASLVKNGDWAPAIQAAVDAHEIVFFPKGEYPVRSTIQLKPDSKLIGMGPWRSRIVGVDEPGRRFGGGKGDVELPVIRTADDAGAHTVLAFLGVYQPNTLTQHGQTPLACYPLLWQSGRDSIVRMCWFGRNGGANWRFEYSVSRGKQAISLEGASLPIAHAATGLSIDSLNATASQLLMETVGGKPRLMTKTSPKGSDVQLKAASGTFDLASLDVCNATFDPNARAVITLTGVTASGETKTTTVEVGKEVPADRKGGFQWKLDWKGLASASITSPSPFGLAAITTGKGTLQPASVDTTRNLALMKTIKTYGFEHYPYSPIRHPFVLISGHGGGKWYNVWYHGDIFAQTDFRFLEVKDNTSPLAFYSWHLQHIHSDAEAVFDHAQDVSVYGVKHEHSSCFLEVHDSDRIRLIGSGGLSDAAPGSAHFKFYNTPNFLLACLADEVHPMRKETQVHNKDNPLVEIWAKAYNGIWDVQKGVKAADDISGETTIVRPILWRRGDYLPTPK